MMPVGFEENFGGRVVRSVCRYCCFVKNHDTCTGRNTPVVDDGNHDLFVGSTKLRNIGCDISPFRIFDSVFSGGSGTCLGYSLLFHLRQCVPKLLHARDQLFLSYKTPLPLFLLLKKNGFLSRIGGFLRDVCLPQADSSSRHSKNNQANLCQEDFSLKRCVRLLVFALLFFFACAGFLLTLHWPWEDRNSAFVMMIVILFVVGIVGQLSVFCFMQTLTGR